MVLKSAPLLKKEKNSGFDSEMAERKKQHAWNVYEQQCKRYFTCGTPKPPPNEHKNSYAWDGTPVGKLQLSNEKKNLVSRLIRSTTLNGRSSTSIEVTFLDQKSKTLTKILSSIDEERNLCSFIGAEKLVVDVLGRRAL